MQSSPHPAPVSPCTLSHVQTMMSSSSTTLRFRWANRFRSTCRTAGRGPVSSDPSARASSRASCIEHAGHFTSAFLPLPCARLRLLPPSHPRTSSAPARRSTRSSAAPRACVSRLRATSARSTIAPLPRFQLDLRQPLACDTPSVSATVPSRASFLRRVPFSCVPRVFHTFCTHLEVADAEETAPRVRGCAFRNVRNGRAQSRQVRPSSLAIDTLETKDLDADREERGHRRKVSMGSEEERYR